MKDLLKRWFEFIISKKNWMNFGKLMMITLLGLLVTISMSLDVRVMTPEMTTSL